jgi:hypothetical protein
MWLSARIHTLMLANFCILTIIIKLLILLNFEWII